MTALKTEFSAGAAAGNSLSAYRNKTIYDSSTNAATTIPGSGAISFSTFRGKRSLAPPVLTVNPPTFSNGNVTFSWSSTNAISYSFTYYYISNGTTYQPIGYQAMTQTSWPPFAAVPGYSYYSYVSATNAAGSVTANSSTVTYTPPVATANTPTISAGVLTYTWSATNTPTSYAVNLYQSGSGTALATQTTGTSATYSSLTSGYVYSIKVTATNAAGTSALVTSGTVTYNPPVATANTPTISAGVLTYTWSGTNSPTSYSVNLYQSGSVTALATQTTGTSATYSSLTSGYVYSIKVTATNAQGTSALVTSGTVTYTPPVATANTPTGAVLPYIELANGAPFPTGGTSFSLLNTGVGQYSQWYKLMIRYLLGGSQYYFTTPANTAGQDVNVAENATYNDFTMPAGNITSLTIKALNANSHQTEITYTNTSGTITNVNSYNSYAGAFQTSDTVLSVRTGGALITYTWSGTNSPTGYTVNLYASGNGTALATLTNTAATSATYVPISGTTYYTTVIATNAQGSSSSAQSANFTYTLPVPTAPTNVTVAVNHTTSVITVGWTAVAGATSYTLSDGISPVSVSAASGTLTLLNTGTTQVISVRGVNASGNGAVTTACSFIYFGSKSSYYILTTAPAQSVNVIMAGAAGGSSFTNSGGQGGLLTGTASLAGTWYITAGTLGESTTTTAGGAAGYPYGSAGATYSSGKGGGGGGGATIISASSGLDQNYHFAAGGGGAGKTDGGNAGGTGASGTGVAGTTSSPNTGGAGGNSAGATSLFHGSDGTANSPATGGGGGGGAGFHAGAGGNGGGGGGGENYNQNLTGATVSLNAAASAGYLFLYWNTPAPTFT